MIFLGPYLKHRKDKYLWWGMLAWSILAMHLAAETLLVGAGRQFASIAQAIAAAQAGDRIEVAGGIYPGNLIIAKKLALIGHGKPVIQGEGKNSAVVILADGCELRGFTIVHCGFFLQQEDSGILIKSSHNTITENDLRDILFGIYFYNAHHNTVADNTIQGRSEMGLGERGSGLHLWDAHDNVLTHNQICQTRDGIYIQNCNNTVVRHNRIWDLRYGLHYMYSDSNIFEENVFTNNMVGGAIMYSKNIRFANNAFLHNRAFSSYGLLYQDCHNCVAEHNAIVDNAIGIFLESGRNNIFRKNLIAESDLAITMFANAEATVFTENNFINNLSPIQVIGKRTTTKWSLAGRGNYWSHYQGYDLDGDGIGDLPCKIQNIFELLEAEAPQIRLYLHSPAAQALDVAERAFPVIQFTYEADPAPLVKPAALQVNIAAEIAPVPGAANRWFMILACLALCGASAWLSVKKYRQNAT